MSILSFITHLFNKKQSTVKTKSYDEIVKDAGSQNSEQAKAEKNSRAHKLKAATGLQTQVNNAQLEVLTAEEAFEKAVLSGTGIAAAGLALKSAEETLTFHQDLYKSLFGSEQGR